MKENKKTRTRPSKRSRKQEKNKENTLSTMETSKKKKTFFFSWSFSWSSYRFLYFFLFSFINSHLWRWPEKEILFFVALEFQRMNGFLVCQRLSSSKEHQKYLYQQVLSRMIKKSSSFRETGSFIRDSSMTLPTDWGQKCQFCQHGNFIRCPRVPRVGIRRNKISKT